ncbi:hypothetical protein HK098_006241 [Nowakowskiella sp. JEL0407]|nr:hypothetical protein HK098_006241 [Nowakowskiella sp. JEL0407]
MVKKYGLNLLISVDDGVQSYLNQILSQIEQWILAKKISKLVLVISSRDTREVVERWQFDIQLEHVDEGPQPIQKLGTQGKDPVVKTVKEINSEISSILRQITASVSFLPMLDDPCTFNILAYTEKDAEVPATWIDSDAKMIAKNAEQVKLRSFSTSVHRVDSLVAYRCDN